MTKLEFLDKINDILIGLNTAESDALGSLYDELIRSQWIPVEERLPEENTAPLVRMDLSDKFGEETIIYDVVVFDWNGFHTTYKVTHWMPIVSPRKEVDNDNK